MSVWWHTILCSISVGAFLLFQWNPPFWMLQAGQAVSPVRRFHRLLSSRQVSHSWIGGANMLGAWVGYSWKVLLKQVFKVHTEDNLCVASGCCCCFFFFSLKSLGVLEFHYFWVDCHWMQHGCLWLGVEWFVMTEAKGGVLFGKVSAPAWWDGAEMSALSKNNNNKQTNNQKHT